jgi:hypothetical protein
MWLRFLLVWYQLILLRFERHHLRLLLSHEVLMLRSGVVLVLLAVAGWVGMIAA